ncbi:DUF932 domain-containing protein [Planctomycetota bacterium]
MIRASSFIIQNPERRNSGDKWLGSPVRQYSGAIEEACKYIPRFERRPFALTNDYLDFKAVNPNYDLIVRLALSHDEVEMPIGIVSKNYNLVQHRKIVEIATEAVREAHIDLNKVEAEVNITEYGERIQLCFLFPDEDKYRFDPGDDQPMGLRLECFNSVDGSTRFVALLGWLRFVCWNGMIVGITRSHIRRPHTDSLDINAVRQVVSEGFRYAEEDKNRFKEWLGHTIKIKEYKDWINSFLRDKWGVKAAARFYHIAKTGRDAEFQDPFEKALPTEKRMRPTKKVPGSTVPASNAFGVSQILSWLAKEHRDIQEQLRYTREISDLMENFLG